jgi:cystine transport system ATP-binding protein
MIRLTHIDKHFGRSQVLRRVSISAREGSVTALIGPSGAGKSTLLRCVNLLEIPDAGELVLGEEVVHFGSRPPGREAIRRVRRQTGMVFQNFQLFPHRTALGNVMEGLLVVQKWPPEKARAHAFELLDKVGLADKARSWPAQLSGGQQQRVAIARALASSPRVLLCDEPTSALDPELALEVVEVLSQLAREGTTMIIATHDLRLAAQVAGEVVVLEAGEVIESGPATALFSNPRHERTQRFIATLGHALPSAGIGTISQRAS